LYKDSGRSLSQISEELGIPHAKLAGWIQSYAIDKEEAFPGKGFLKSSDAEMQKNFL